ncbi:hypothetical protein JMJ78_0008258 [Colletotrichum scovillei]|nr:hypothetical protein JMJ78_0008258 [Colletotrichum scovillei]
MPAVTPISRKVFVIIALHQAHFEKVMSAYRSFKSNPPLPGTPLFLAPTKTMGSQPNLLITINY